MSVGSPAAIHALIEHLIRHPQEQPQLRVDAEPLLDRFAVPQEQRAVLRNGGRDDLAALGVHGNYVIKWLIWSGRPSMPFFAIGHYFDRR